MTELKKKSICLVDDDEDLTSLISRYLSANDYEVHVIHDGQDACDKIPLIKPDLILLDVMLPSMDGLSVCRHLKSEYNFPIIMLTALDDDIDEVAGLEIGADDYLSKPVSPQILLARVNAILRRTPKTISKSTIKKTPFHTLRSFDLKIDCLQQTVTYAERQIPLSANEMRVLWVLTKNYGEVLSRETLYEAIFSDKFELSDRTIDLCVSRIRKQFDTFIEKKDIIKTVRNEGYLINLS